MHAVTILRSLEARVAAALDDADPAESWHSSPSGRRKLLRVTAQSLGESAEALDALLVATLSRTPHPSKPRSPNMCDGGKRSRKRRG